MNNNEDIFDLMEQAQAENNKEFLQTVYATFNDLLKQSYEQVKKTFPEADIKTPEDYKEWQQMTTAEQWKVLTGEQQEKIKTEIARKYPNYLIVGHTLLQNNLFNDSNVKDYSDYIQQLTVAKDTEIEASVDPRFYLDETGKKNITGLGILADNPAFCNSVFVALCSVIKPYMKEDNRTFKETPFIDTTQLYNMMNRGKKKTPDRMKKLIDEVLTCLDTTHLYCNYTAQAKKWGLPMDQGEYIRRETILSLAKDSIVVNGQKIDGYFVRNVPFLLEYAFTFNQVIQIPIQDIPAISRADENKINIRLYLMKEIRTGKNQKLKYIDRLYSTIFTNSSIRTTHKTQLDRHKDFIVNELLTPMKKNGTIKSFEELASGKTRANGRDKIRIFLNYEK